MFYKRVLDKKIKNFLVKIKTNIRTAVEEEVNHPRGVNNNNKNNRRGNELAIYSSFQYFRRLSKEYIFIIYIYDL